MKFRNLVVVSFFACLLMSACGGSSSSNSFYNVITSGNWSIQATSLRSGAVLDIGGSLVQKGSQVTGVLHIANARVPNTNTYCYDVVNDDVPVTGSFQGNLLTLTSTPVHSQVLTISATGQGNTLYDNPTATPPLYGYMIAGGCDDGDYGTFTAGGNSFSTANYVAPITASWYATVTDQASGDDVQVQADVTQAGAADSHGRFPLTGALTFTDQMTQGTWSCASTGTLGTGSVAWGNNVSFAAATTGSNNAAGTATFAGQAIFESNPIAVSGPYQITSGACADQTYPSKFCEGQACQ